MITFLNSLPERDLNENLLRPIDFNELKWDDFLKEMHLTLRALRFCQRNLKLLIPKSKRHRLSEHDWNSDDVLESTSKKWVLFNDANVKDDYGYLKHQMNAYIYAYYGKYIQNENLI